jgi:hypothetical protein
MSNQRKETGPLSSLQKRVMTLETLTRQPGESLICGSVERVNTGKTSLLEQLDELTREAGRIQAQAEAIRDHRTALLCIRTRCQIIELMARLGGELEDRSQTNVVNVHLDPETAKRMAETYLARLRPTEAKCTATNS